MKTIIMCMAIDPFFAILAIGQFISYLGFISISVFVCKKVLSRR
ncbi:hypothetical protein [Faecalitalea cylindroides]|nr:hypothetical protein [Faecalitalea cylindroides]